MEFKPLELSCNMEWQCNISIYPTFDVTAAYIMKTHITVIKHRYLLPGHFCEAGEREEGGYATVQSFLTVNTQDI